jgi:glycerol uptake facilitator-like aquaporin
MPCGILSTIWWRSAARTLVASAWLRRETLLKQLIAEFIGTLLLLATVVGSGIMGETLAGGNTAIALLANTIATGAILVVLILMFGPLSGAHFNPAVTLAFLIRQEIQRSRAFLYVLVQVAGAITGVWIAHGMFEQEILQLSTTARTGAGQWFAEGVATFGLVGTILAVLRHRPDAVPFAVGLYITAAYWFTASTSFANPAVTIARGLTNTFSGIQPDHVLAFILAQITGAVFATWLMGYLLGTRQSAD